MKKTVGIPRSREVARLSPPEQKEENTGKSEGLLGLMGYVSFRT